MPKHIIKRYMPDHQRVKEHKHLQIFGSLLRSSDLWHLNRHSISGAFSVGLFIAWVPIPFQMVLAAAAAIYFRVNLPISVGLVWITNPITMPILFWLAYWVGAGILGTPPINIEFAQSYQWLKDILPLIWKPFLLGCLINGTVSAVAGYYGIRTFWIWHVGRQWKRRQLQRRR